MKFFKIMGLDNFSDTQILLCCYQVVKLHYLIFYTPCYVYLLYFLLTGQISPETGGEQDAYQYPY